MGCSISLAFRFMSVLSLEMEADKRWGHLPEYQRYKQQTPEFFPAIPTK